MSIVFDSNLKYATLGKWSLLKALGSGATSKVYLGYDPIGKKYAAIKVLKKVDTRYLPIIKNEVVIQNSLKDDNILKLQEFHESIVLCDAEDRNFNVVAIVIDIAKGGDVLLLIEKLGIFPERLARTYFHQLISALECLQSHQIAHRDIKPENIMLDGDFCIKLADFGCASKYSSRSFRTPAGTSKYFPPEEHLGIPYDGAAADLFATAIVVFAMVTGHMPFSKAVPEDSLYGLLSKGKAKTYWLKHEEITKKQGGAKFLNADFKDLMTKMLESNPSKRLTIEEIKKSAWYNGPVLQNSEVAKLIKQKLC